jgi:phosphate-selective porin OprO and OprP
VEVKWPAFAFLALGPSVVLADEEDVAVRFKAGFGDGVAIETRDGSFGMGLRARTQARVSVVVPEEDERDPTADFQIRRLRLSLDAHAWDELVTMRIQLAFSPQDQDPVAPVPLRDAFITFSPLRDLRIRAGQMKVPFGRQRVVSSGNLQMVDRSIVTSELNLDRDVGVQIFSQDLFGLDGVLGYNLGVFGGDGRNRVSGGYGFLYAGRLAVRPVGGKLADDLDEVDFAGTKPRLQAAVSGAFNHQSDRVRSTIGEVFATGPWVDYFHVGADTSFKFAGLAMTGEFFLRQARVESRTNVVDDVPVTDVARSGYGGFFQVGQLFAERFEVSARVGSLTALGELEGGFKPEREIGGAVSWYFQEHALKLQADTFYLWEDWGQGRVQARLQVQMAP